MVTGTRPQRRMRTCNKRVKASMPPQPPRNSEHRARTWTCIQREEFVERTEHTSLASGGGGGAPPPPPQL
jgi:hypothetical protein